MYVELDGDIVEMLVEEWFLLFYDGWSDVVFVDFYDIDMVVDGWLEDCVCIVCVWVFGKILYGCEY